jgi:RNA polymerase sigma factor (sigma-70 family)
MTASNEGAANMPEVSTRLVVGWYDALFRDGTYSALSDAQLLERFAASDTASEPAFEVLVGRHGPMVLGVCRRILRNDHDAADAFQATFLVLVRRACAIRDRKSLGPWLHGVARRVAVRAMASARLRAEREARMAIDPARKATVAESPADDRDLGPALHEEIDRLPERYRAPIVLCYLQGQTIAEASRLLGWPVGTVGGRLARARDRLRDRLVRRGLGSPAALASALCAGPWRAALVPRGLVRSTAWVAIQLAAGRPATSVVSAGVASLFGEIMRTMAWTRWMIGARACVLLGALVIGAGAISVPSGQSGSAPQQPGIQATGSTNPVPAAVTATTRALQEASGLADDLSDPQERFDALLALAWAQIKSGDRDSARQTLGRAQAVKFGLIGAESRCISRVRIAQALGEAGDRRGGLNLLKLALLDARLGGSRSWVLKSLAVAQCELGDRASARATIQALDESILTPQQRTQGIWTSELTNLAEARIAVGDFDDAFRTCFPPLPADVNNRHFQVALKQQPWMLMELASAAADTNHESRHGDDPPRIFTAGQRATRLELVRRAVAAVEELPEANERRPILAVSLAKLGAFDEALAVARRIDQKQIRGETVDATWALWRISMEQAKAGKLDDGRATIREAVRLESPAGAEPEDRRNMQSPTGAEPGDRRNVLAWGFLAARDPDGALKVAETLNPYIHAAVLAKVASQKLQAGNRAGAEPLFRRALDEAERFRKSPPVPPRQPQHQPPPAGNPRIDPQTKHQVEYLSLLAEIHARGGGWSAADKALAGIPSEGREKGAAAFHVAVIRARSGDVAGTLAWARALPSSSLQSWAIRGLAYSIYDDLADQF